MLGRDGTPWGSDGIVIMDFRAKMVQAGTSRYRDLMPFSGTTLLKKARNF
jgi:hypothetical protein